MKKRSVLILLNIAIIGMCLHFHGCFLVKEDSDNALHFFVRNNGSSDAKVIGVNGGDTLKILQIPKDSTVKIGYSFVVGGGDMMFFNSDTAYVFFGDSLDMKYFLDASFTERNILRTSDYEKENVGEVFTLKP